ncbi:hypothetical protein K9B33_17845 [Sphingobium sp. 3R8]|uniref:helix-turn-helix domain-containing protein n=1 Tax=Sphingobium sp. 3R8 TaxID=2874921 RepID=UPI001CCE8AF0|nr:XRE family transcriptional regulator [Sphingobium sp. 3R8]MBZ9649401.1 hypothetical protein [Sphingobium sp. 3R8]
MTEEKKKGRWEIIVPPLELTLERIDERLKELGLSDRQASIRATGYPDAIREIRRGKRPSSDRFIQLANALETTPDYLSGHVEHQSQAFWRTTTQSALPIEGVIELPRNIPVYGIADDGGIGAMDFDGAKGIEVLKYDLSKPIDYCRRPPRLALRDDIIAISVFGTSAYPRFEEADILYLEPDMGRDGDYVFLALKGDVTDRSGAPGRWMMLKRLVNNTPVLRDDENPFQVSHLVEQFTPPVQFKVPADLISKRYKVLTQNQLLSL